MTFQLSIESSPDRHCKNANFRPNFEEKILTKGDNNEVDDRGIYFKNDKNMFYLEKKHILGRVRANLPYVGMLTIWLNDYPMLKWGMIGSMLLLVLVGKDPQA